jgi:hypothetical protein
MERPDPKPPREPPPTPNRPKDPGVYGGQWGGDEKAPGPPPPDRPEPIKPPPQSR